MIPVVLYRGAVSNIQKQVIRNFDKGEPLGPGIYATDSLDTARYYTNNGFSLYKLVLSDTFIGQDDGVIELSKKLSEQPISVRNKITAVLNKHFGFLENDESKNLNELLFGRDNDVEKYNNDLNDAHKTCLQGSVWAFPHFFAKIFLDFFKLRFCKTPETKPIPRDEDVIESLISMGIWIGVGTLEGTYFYNGRMDAGLQYLIYNENAIAENIELPSEE